MLLGTTLQIDFILASEFAAGAAGPKASGDLRVLAGANVTICYAHTHFFTLFIHLVSPLHLLSIDYMPETEGFIPVYRWGD